MLLASQAMLNDYDENAKKSFKIKDLARDGFKTGGG
jgi:hypothetical protein